MTALNLSSCVEVDLHKRVVVLPKVALHDFAGGRRSGSATPLECLRSLLCYVKREDKLGILRLLSEGVSSHPVVRMKNPSLRCRVFQVMQDGDTETSAVSHYAAAEEVLPAGANVTNT